MDEMTREEIIKRHRRYQNFMRSINCCPLCSTPLTLIHEINEEDQVIKERLIVKNVMLKLAKKIIGVTRKRQEFVVQTSQTIDGENPLPQRHVIFNIPPMKNILWFANLVLIFQLITAPTLAQQSPEAAKKSPPEKVEKPKLKKEKKGETCVC